MSKNMQPALNHKISHAESQTIGIIILLSPIALSCLKMPFPAVWKDRLETKGLDIGNAFI
jgi:hypothetical protein